MRDIVKYTSNNDTSHAYISFGEKEIYQKSIEKVCNKLDFDDSEVTWVMYDPKDPPPTHMYDSVFKPDKFLKSLINPLPDHYYINFSEKKIYISNNSLLCSSLPKNNFFEKKISDINLIDELLIDAITRLQTQTTEDSDFFKEKLKENLDKFSPVDLSKILS